MQSHSCRSPEDSKVESRSAFSVFLTKERLLFDRLFWLLNSVEGYNIRRLKLPFYQSISRRSSIFCPKASD